MKIFFHLAYQGYGECGMGLMPKKSVKMAGVDAQNKYLSRVVCHLLAASGGRETIKCYVLATTKTYFNTHGYIYHFASGTREH